MSKFVDPTDSMAPEAVFYCVWEYGPEPRFSRVAEELAILRKCSPTEARDALTRAVEAGEVRIRWSDAEHGPYLAIDGAVADAIGVRYTFHKLWGNGLGPTDIYTGNDADIVEAYQPLLVEALREEGVTWPGR